MWCMKNKSNGFTKPKVIILHSRLSKLTPQNTRYSGIPYWKSEFSDILEWIISWLGKRVSRYDKKSISDTIKGVFPSL